MTSPLTGKITALRMASRESESARGGGGRGGDDGFTMCVSVAVETTGWQPAQQCWHRGELVNKLQCSAQTRGSAGATLGGVNGAASKMAPQAGEPRICSTLQRQSGGTWAHNPQGHDTTRKDTGTSRGSLGARRSGGRGEGGRGRGVNCSEPSPTLHLPAANLCVHSGGQTGACVSMGETPTREKTKVTSAG